MYGGRTGGTPTLPFLIKELQTRLRKQSYIGLLLADVSITEELEEELGWKAFDEAMEFVGQELGRIKSAALRKEDILCETMRSGNSFTVILSPPRRKVEIKLENLSRLAERLRDLLASSLEKRMNPNLGGKLVYYLGRSLVKRTSQVPIQLLVAKAVNEAYHDCWQQKLLNQERKESLHRSFFLRQGVTTIFQPIIDLGSLETVGYAALIKTVEGELESPETISHPSGETSLELKRTYLTHVLQNTLNLNYRPLFLGLDPLVLDETELHRLTKISLQPTPNLSPERIVIELSEERLANNFKLCRSIMAYLKSLGYKVALSGVTGTHSSLGMMSDSLLDYVALDRRLFKNLENDGVKRAVVSTLVRLANGGNLGLVGCGLEKESEIRKARELGVSWGWKKHISQESPKLFMVAPLVQE